MVHKVNVELRIKKSHEFSNEDIDDLMSTALNGGINDWVDIIQVEEGSMSDDAYDSCNGMEEIISKGGTLIITTVDDDVQTLDIVKLLNGIKAHCENVNMSPSELMDLHDADDADEIVQFALYDELIYS